jgi:hypothetical protein
MIEDEIDEGSERERRTRYAKQTTCHRMGATPRHPNQNIAERQDASPRSTRQTTRHTHPAERYDPS